MCTFSLVRAPWQETPAGLAWPDWRVVFNRDERRARQPGLPPVARDYDGVRAIHPIDPDGAGTWLAATSAGLVFALLNETQALSRRGATPVISRGLVIPSLLSARSLDDVESRLAKYSADRHRPFRLLAVSDQAVVEMVHAGAGSSVTRHDASTRLIRTSSSVEPADTQKRRTALFEHLVPVPSVAAQDRFHAHRWPQAPGVSVLMTRPDARTVSVTVVDVIAHGFRLAYRPLPDGLADVTELARAA